MRSVLRRHSRPEIDARNRLTLDGGDLVICMEESYRCYTIVNVEARLLLLGCSCRSTKRVYQTSISPYLLKGY